VPTVLVTIPTFNTPPELLRRAVDSVLDQTFSDFDLWVVNDGPDASSVHDALCGLDDPRVSVLTRPRNEGRYAIDHHVVHTGTDHFYWAPLDADDWAEPDWLERMVDHADNFALTAVFTDQWVHPPNDTLPRVEPAVAWDGSARFVWHAHLSGLWDLAWLRRSGITNPHARVAWDTVMTSAAFLLGDAGIIHEPLVHRVRRAGSLTASPGTGFGSPYREACADLYATAWRQMVAEPARAAEIVATLAPMEQRHSFASHIPALRVDAWAMQRDALAELDRRLWTLKPRVIVECGSGVSTRVLAEYAARTGATVLSLEQDERYAHRTRRSLGRLARNVEVRHVPLAQTAHGPWYDTVLPDNIDFALIDGPTEASGGRAVTFPHIYPHLTGNWEVWLDDAARPGEAAALDGWREAFGVAVEHTNINHDIVRLRPTPAALNRSMSRFDDVVVTILTGSRPELLNDTLVHLPWEVLETADRVIVLCNGGDDDTLNVISDHLRWRNDAEILTTDTLLPMGEAMGVLADAARGTARYVLHLEDDWRHITVDDGWIDDAKAALTDDVAQVRLRHHGEMVRARHMVTNHLIRWRRHPYGLIAPAHLTVNPSLMRTDDWAKHWPATGERHWQQRCVAAGLTTVVQLHPGVFAHTGDGRSLREETGCPA
jgi:hypothetical protein